MSILNNYLGRDRYYHNFDHIGDMISKLNVYFPYHSEDQALKYAILYHDVIYVAGSTMNEFHSAEALARDLPKYELSQKNLQEAQRLIMQTQHHKPVEGDILGQIIVDLDLAGLASNQYQLNSLNVRSEFGAFSDDVWRTGRKEWLTDFLSRETVYHTDLGKALWEDDARVNMQAELEYLEGLNADSV